MWNRTRELDDLEPATDLAARIVEGLAVLAHHQLGKVVAMAVDKLSISKENALPSSDGSVAPRRKRRRVRRER